MGLSNEAMRLAELGYHVFPCVPGEKRPLTEHGVNDATTDDEQIAEWWDRWPNANIGVSTDGLLVIDIDPVNGESNPWCSEIEQQAELMTGAATVTPRRGNHFWFSAGGRDLRNTASKIAPGVDTRANGGYVIVPPSETAEGIYQWAPFYDLRFGPDDLPEPPDWLLGMLDGTMVKVTPEKTESTYSEGVIGEGQRNHALTQLAGLMRRGGMGFEEIRAALRATNTNRCVPILDVDEVDAIASSVCRYDPEQAVQANIEGWYDADRIKNADKPKKRPDPGPLPKELLHVPGLIGDLIAWNCSTAYKPQPELAMAAALSLMATITGRKIEDELGTRTNLYVLGVCESGGGKEHARKCNKQLLNSAGMQSMIGPEGVGSHAGLVSAVNRTPPIVLLQIDEIGRVLKTMNNPERSPHLYNIITVLMKLFTSSNSLYQGDAYADVKKAVSIDQPHCCMYATTVPKSFFESLTSDSLSDGFMSRMLIFEAANNDPDPCKPVRDPSPRHLIEQVSWWGNYQPGGNLNAQNPQPRVIETEACEHVFKDLEKTIREKRKHEDGAALWTRACEKSRKLALMHAVSMNPEAASVTKQSAEWACQLVTHLTERLEVLAEAWVSDGNFDAMQKLILRHIEKAGTNGISSSQLYLKVRHMRPRERKEALDSLQECGQVVTERINTKGRPSIVYKARS